MVVPSNRPLQKGCSAINHEFWGTPMAMESSPLGVVSCSIPNLWGFMVVPCSFQAQFKSFELSTTLWALAKLGSMEDAGAQRGCQGGTEGEIP